MGFLAGDSDRADAETRDEKSAYSGRGVGAPSGAYSTRQARDSVRALAAEHDDTIDKSTSLEDVMGIDR